MDTDNNSNKGKSRKNERRQRQQMKLESGRMLTEEEYAAEIAVADSNLRRTERPNAVSKRNGDVAPTNQGGRTMGWIALIFSFVSLFLWPVIMGPTAIVLGAVALFQGNRAMAVWSMVIGMIAFVAYLALLPFYR